MDGYGGIFSRSSSIDLAKANEFKLPSLGNYTEVRTSALASRKK
jgi:hypothetical protein